MSSRPQYTLKVRPRLLDFAIIYYSSAGYTIYIHPPHPFNQILGDFVASDSDLPEHPSDAIRVNLSMAALIDINGIILVLLKQTDSTVPRGIKSNAKPLSLDAYILDK